MVRRADLAALPVLGMTAVKEAACAAAWLQLRKFVGVCPVYFLNTL